MEHAVEVSAGSLYEAAALGLRAFRESQFSEEFQPGSATQLIVRVSAEEARHEVNVRQVETWLTGGGKNPREQALKTKMRQALSGKGVDSTPAAQDGAGSRKAG